MIPSNQLEQAISIHERSYQLLQWVSKAMTAGYIPAANAHGVCTGGEAALAWIDKHYLNLPVACRPGRDEMGAFANFFGSYLETSFDVADTPRIRFVSDYGCYCAVCRRIAMAAHLVPKPVETQDKKRAAKLRMRRIEVLALEESIVLPDAVVASLAGGATIRDAALSAYAASLVERLKGICSGFGVQALWREIAWCNGSPDRRFRLKAEDIIAAECRLVSAIRQAQVTAAWSCN